MEDPLTWDDTYAIAKALIQQYPGVNLEGVTLGMLSSWIIELPQFVDDPQMQNEAILMAIFCEWFEEVNKI